MQTIFATIANRETEPGDIVYAIHYDGEDPNMRRTGLTVTETSSELPTAAVPNDGNDTNASNAGGNSSIPFMMLQPTMQPGASGSPIINENFKLVGLVVGGGEVGNSLARDVALTWNNSIKQFIDTGVKIITVIDGYMATYKNRDYHQDAAKAKEMLEREARNARLTVYLMNGEVINGPE